MTLRRPGAALAALMLVLATAPACGGSDDEVVVLAAASLAEAFRALEGPAREAGVEPVYSFAASHLVVEQGAQGAPADVVAVADAGLIEGGTVFATNRLVVVTLADRPDLVAVADLARPGVRVVLAAEAVPAGRYAREGLRREGLLDAVLENVVSNEADVRGVAAKVALGEADAGVVYVSDLQGDDRLRAVGEPLPVRAEYAAAIAPEPPNPSGGRRFVEFLGSGAARDVLGAAGFEPASAGDR